MKRALVFVLFACSIAAAQIPRVRGMVVDAASHEPVAGAVIRLVPGTTGAVTGEDGRFTMTAILEGIYQIVVSRVGYRPVRHRDFRVYAALDTSLLIALVEEAISEGPVVVTASRRAQVLADVPVSMATLDAEEISSRVPINADDALRTVSGVSLVEDQINIRGSSGYSRGVGSRVLLLVDGIPMLTGDTGEINWETIPVHQIERIEVVKGAGSALYGSSALGGVVNIITKDIERGTHVAIRTVAGVYDRLPHAEWNWSARLRRTSGLYATVATRPDNIGYLVSIQRTMDESYRQNDLTHRYGFFGKLAWQLEGSATLLLTVNAVHRLNGNFFWWKSLRQPALPPDEQQNRWVESTRGNVSVEYRQPTSEGSSLVLRGQYYGNDWLDRIGEVVGNRSRSDQFTVEGQLTQAVGERLILIGGVAGHGDRVRSDIFGTHPGIGVAIFVQSEYRATEEISLSAGLRWDRQKVSVLAAASQLDPRVAITYRPAPLTTVRGSWGTGFRYPSIGELYTSVSTGFGSVNVVPNPALEPERSVSVEVGVHQVVGDGGWIDGALFHADYRQLIEAGVDPDLFVIRFDNVARARIQGVEISAGMSWWDGVITTRLGLTAMEPRDLTKNGPLKFRPKFTGVSSAECILGIFRAGIDYRYISRQEAIDEDLIAIANILDGSERVPIHVLDVRCSVALDAWGLQVRPGLVVKNSLNYQYVELVGNLAPPRTVVFTLDALL